MNIWFDLVGFYVISSPVGYLKPYPLYTYILNMFWFGWVLRHTNSCGSFKAKSHLFIYIRYIWFGLILWHINHCRLFNAESSLKVCIEYMIWFGWLLCHIISCRLFKAISSLYIYIKYKWFDLVGFYIISTLVGYLNQIFFIHIYQIYMIWFSFMAYQPLHVI